MLVNKNPLALGISAALLTFAATTQAAPGLTPQSEPLSLSAAQEAQLVSNEGERYIVTFKEGKRALGRKALRSMGGKIKLERADRRWMAARVKGAQLEALRNDPTVESIEVDHKRYMLAEQVPFGISLVQADQLEYIGSSGRTVCVIDSGYDIANVDLQDNALGLQAPDVGDVFNPGDIHGTHVTGTAVALGGNGVGVRGVIQNGQANVIHYKIFDDNAAFTRASTLIDGLNACEANGGEGTVVNMSLGGGGSSAAEDAAFAAAQDRGVLSIAAAGNDGNGTFSFPASYDSVVSVAALDANEVVADFSQFNTQVELAAPGVDVRSTVIVGTGDNNSLDANGTTFDPRSLDGTPNGTVSGALVDCGLGDQGTCTGVTNNICLIQRGAVSFSDKVLACQNGGGIGAIIFNNVPGPLLGTLGGVATNIPGVGVSDTEGAALLASLGSNANLTVAPGDFGFLNGTSMASPHVAGVAALVWSFDPTCTAAEIRDLLGRTAKDLGDPGRDINFGFGIVQAADAVAELQANGCAGNGNGGGNPPPPPPPPAGAFFETDRNVSIPDARRRRAGNPANSPIEVSGVADAGTFTVNTNIVHTFRGDLRVEVVLPGGAVGTIKTEDVNDSAADVITSTTFNGAGLGANGTWNLRAQDFFRGDRGTIDSWSLQF